MGGKEMEEKNPSNEPSKVPNSLIIHYEYIITTSYMKVSVIVVILYNTEWNKVSYEKQEENQTLDQAKSLRNYAWYKDVMLFYKLYQRE